MTWNYLIIRTVGVAKNNVPFFIPVPTTVGEIDGLLHPYHETNRRECVLCFGLIVSTVSQSVSVGLPLQEASLPRGIISHLMRHI